MASDSLDAPRDLSLDTTVVDVCFHPSRDAIAVGKIDGVVNVFSYSTAENNHQLVTLPHHKKSCRALRFSTSGERLFTVSKDKSLQMVDMNSGTVTQKIKKAHESALYSLLVVDENIVATGDDDGFLKVWDMRQNKAVMSLKENDEFISDMDVEKNKRYLVATSGDGTLSAFDIRKHKLKVQSELFDSELLSVAIVKGGDKVVCGSGEGVLNIFNWGEWGNLSDRFPGHPMSIDCLVPVSDDKVITGSMDGVIRAVNLLPNRFLGVVGEHNEFPIENMSLSHCGSYLASCSHDELVKFWNLDAVLKEKVSTKRKANKSSQKKPLGKNSAANFFAGLVDGGGGDEEKDENESGENESDESDENESSENDSDDNESEDEKEIQKAIKRKLQAKNLNKGGEQLKKKGKFIGDNEQSGSSVEATGGNKGGKKTSESKDNDGDSDDLNNSESDSEHLENSSFSGGNPVTLESTSDSSSEDEN